MLDLNAADLEAAMRIVAAARARWASSWRACNAAHLETQKGLRQESRPAKSYPALEALKLVKDTATAKFDEAVDVAVNLGIDAKKGDQTVRGSVVLPAGTGRTCAPRCSPRRQGRGGEGGGRRHRRHGRPRRAGEGGQDGFRRGDRGAGSDARGRARPDPRPRGLMPNPKVGTVTPDVAGAVKNAKAGQVQFRADKTGIVQCTIGRASFTVEQLKGNLPRWSTP